MANLNNLRVDQIADLRNDAETLALLGDNLQTISVVNMQQVIADTMSVWDGKAAQRYRSQFESLTDDMSRIVAMVHDYSNDLSEIATNYENTEDTNETTASSLSASIDLI